MSAPTVKNFTQAVLSDTGTVSSPSDTSIGDLVVCFVWSQFTTTATTHTIQSGFTLVRSHSHNDSTTCGRLSVAAKVATAAGTQTYIPFTIASATAGQTAVGLLTITGANTSAPGAWVQGSITDTTATAPNPPALTGLESDVLVLSIAAWSVTTAGATTSTPPTNYTAKIDGPGGTHLTHLAVSTRALTGLSGATEDPATFNDNVTPNGSVAMTIAIPITATYYVTSTGSDSNLGTGTSATTAWKTLTPVNSHTFLPGDNVFFAGGQTFTGGLYIHNVASTNSKPVTLDSYGTGNATISSAVGTVGAYIYQMGGVVIQNLNFTGPGVATANKDGIQFYNDAASTVYSYLRITSCTITGYQNGISIGGGAGTSGYSDVRIQSCSCNTNKKDGIQTYGAAKYSLSNVYIGSCSTYNNTGIAGQGSPTGSGIQLSSVNGGTVEYCVSYGNGASSTAATGPVGIWVYDSTAVIIQNSESYNNTSGGGDGDGFDIDGGCTNCIIQYCYAHGNKGGGFCLFQYAGASTFSGNILRYNVSEKNGLGEINVWGANATSLVTNSDIYNNTVYASLGPAIDFFNTNFTGVTVKNNIFLTVNGMTIFDSPGTANLTLANNNYYNLSGAFVIWWGGTQYSSKAAWGQDAAGKSVNPLLNSPGTGGTVGNAANLPTMTAYQISGSSSPMIDAGAVISSPGLVDFYGNALFYGAADVGSDEYIPAVDSVRFFPRSTWESRMAGGVFEGTNGDPVTGPYTTIYTIPGTPPAAWTQVAAALGTYRYYRYRGPDGTNCNVAEVESTAPEPNLPERDSERLDPIRIRETISPKPSTETLPLIMTPIMDPEIM